MGITMTMTMTAIICNDHDDDDDDDYDDDDNFDCQSDHDGESQKTAALCQNAQVAFVSMPHVLKPLLTKRNNVFV